MAEKLLLHTLIVLCPLFFYTIFFEKREGEAVYRPYLCATLQGAAVVLCMSFPIQANGFNWDLRYVPLLLTILYGGLVPSVIVLAVILVFRLLLGGDAAVYGMVGAVLIAGFFWLLAGKFQTLRPRQRVLAAMGISLVSCAFPFGLFYLYHGWTGAVGQGSVNLVLFALLQAAATGFAVSLTERTREINLMRREIQRAEKLNILGELAASVAHEVRNPLTVVKGFLQIMNEEQNEKHRGYTQLILSELGRAESIINDYLNFAKPQMQKVAVLHVVDVVNEVVTLLYSYGMKNGVEVECCPLDGLYIRTDKNQLKQALINLVKNAIEATPTGGLVQVCLAEEKGMAVITIHDTGKGMSKDQLARLGSLFYTTKDKGTGLGTMVTLRIIESMNGKVQYHSTPGVGTEVTVSLPLFEV